MLRQIFSGVSDEDDEPATESVAALMFGQDADLTEEEDSTA